MEKLLTIDELGKLINVKKATIYDMVYRKRIPYLKIGKLLRFREDLIQSWLEQRTYIPHDMSIKGREKI
jgi:excisionase family DNA binding protein